MPFTPFNADNRRFEDLVSEAKRRITAYAPEWTDFNESDPGITLVQLFAWLTETMLYRLNHVPDDRGYVSFLNLIGYGPQPAFAATAIVEVQVSPGSGTTTLAPFELRLSAPGKDDDIFFEADAPVWLLGARLGAVLVDDGISLARGDFTAQNARGDAYRPFGPTRIVGRALYLGLDATPAAGPPLLVEPGQSAVLQLHVKAEELPTALQPASTSYAQVPTLLDGDLVWEGKSGPASWTVLEVVSDETRALKQSGFLRLKLPDSLVVGKEPGDPDNALRFWIRARASDTQVESRSIRSIVPNAVRVRQWRTYAREQLLPGSNGRPNQEFTVQHPPMLLDAADSVFVEVSEFDAGGRQTFTAWSRVDDLTTREIDGDIQGGSNPLPIYTVEPDRATVRFGDGLDGLIPPRGTNNLFITYRSGGGAEGNVAARQLALAVSVPNVEGIEQNEPASGGIDAEATEAAKNQAPARLKALERAVTPDDFETLARRDALVARATAVNRYHPLIPGVPVTGALTLVVVPPRVGDDRAPVPSQKYLDAVANVLENFRVLTTELFVVAPRYRAVKVDVHVDVATPANASTVRNDVVKAIEAFFDPIEGGLAQDGWPLGGTIVYGEVLGVVLRTPTVAAVRSLTIKLDGSEQPKCSDVALGKLDLIASAGHAVHVYLPEVRRS